MAHVRITLSREMLKALISNLAELRSPAGEFVVENETDGNNEITRIINLSSGDVFEQVVQKQELGIYDKNDCKIIAFPQKYSPANDPDCDDE